MPSRADHISKAQGNEVFVSGIALTTQTNIGWALVVTFYAAVHYVEAYFALTGEHSRTRAVRDRRMNHDPNLSAISTEYGFLKFYSLSARYDFVSFSPSDLTDRALPFLSRIKAHLRPMLLD